MPISAIHLVGRPPPRSRMARWAIGPLPDFGAAMGLTRLNRVKIPLKPLDVVGDAHQSTISSWLRETIIHLRGGSSIEFCGFLKLLAHNTLCRLLTTS
jgi:hypothetical protein